MDEAARFLTLLALTGGAITLVGFAFACFLDETRRIGRALAGALGEAPDPVLIARGRGVGIGFNLGAGLVSVTWDKGAWTLNYRLDELMGAELIVDRAVAARAFRGEGRRPLDHLADPQQRVRLRFLFDDAGRPDFEIDLWTPEDEGLRGRFEAGEALHEANRWMARIEALLRRPPPPSRPAAFVPAAAAPVRQALHPVADAGFAEEAFEDADDPPWDEPEPRRVIT